MSLTLITTAPAAPSVRVEADPKAYRADVVTRYYRACDFAAELRVLAEATRYDQAHPGEPPLVDELLGADLDDLAAA